MKKNFRSYFTAKLFNNTVNIKIQIVLYNFIVFSISFINLFFIQLFVWNRPFSLERLWDILLGQAIQISKRILEKVPNFLQPKQENFQNRNPNFQFSVQHWAYRNSIWVENKLQKCHMGTFHKTRCFHDNIQPIACNLSVCKELGSPKSLNLGQNCQTNYWTFQMLHSLQSCCKQAVLNLS